MNRKFVLLGLTAILMLACSLFFINKSIAAANKRLHFAMISPSGPNNLFWEKYLSYMKAAAKDFNIKLDIYYTNENPYKSKEILNNIINSNQKPNAVLFINNKGLGKDLIKSANNAKIDAFMVNAGFSASEEGLMGKPRVKYPRWIGEMYPDDEYAGYILAKSLIDSAKKQKSGTIHVLGIKGPRGVDSASDARVAGLLRAVKQYDNVVLDQVISGEWSRPIAEKKFITLKTTRFPQISVVWAASDGMALGVIDGAKKLKLKPNKDIITGGVDWIDDALASVKKGEMTSSVGGHFMEGAWVIVAMYDYYNGVDFKKENLSLKTKMFPVTSKNVNFIMDKTNVKNIDAIDFRKFSKKLNPSIKKYNFTLEAL